MSFRQDQAQITAWAVAARGGDREAAAAFIRATSADVHRFLGYLADPGEVEDLAQETYLRMVKALPRFDARASARTWLLAIARRVAADHVRSARRRPRPAALPDWRVAAEADSAGQRFDDGVTLRHLLNALDPDRRDAFVATQVAGLSYAEAAQVCGCPIGTIRSRVSRAREDLIAALHADDATRRGGTAT
jgi:RNA polymerase sigma-70 factor (ECF subfamily)